MDHPIDFPAQARTRAEAEEIKANQANEGEDNRQFATLADLRRFLETEFSEYRKRLRESDFVGDAAEGYVLMMCQNFVLPLLRAYGRELLNSGHRGTTLNEEMRAMTAARLAEVEKIHWAPARDEFGDRRFTTQEFQRRFEAMIRMELEHQVLPELERASSCVQGMALPNKAQHGRAGTGFGAPTASPMSENTGAD